MRNAFRLDHIMHPNLALANHLEPGIDSADHLAEVRPERHRVRLVRDNCCSQALAQACRLFAPPRCRGGFRVLWGFIVNNAPMLIRYVAECAARTRSSPRYIPPGHYRIWWQAVASEEHRHSHLLRVLEDNS